MVEIFDHIGFGQWFRYVTGSVEIIGGLLLLAPRTAMVGAALLLVTMVCAILTHLVLIGGNPAPAFVLVILNAAILWLRRAQIAQLIGRPGDAGIRPAAAGALSQP
jgi:putative oxidoreductase